MARYRILMAEDEADLRALLRMQLECEGFEVLEARDGEEAVRMVHEHTPDLVLLDVMMPKLDGHEVSRRLRASFSTRHIPIVMLTARVELKDKVRGLEGGANDYVTKPWERKELLLRIRNVLDWSQQQRAASPLTGLPGNHSINDEIRRRLASGKPFALLQVDVDHFKSFNDYYGYARGDQAIQMLARILTEVTQRLGGPEGFVGHIGGDDFVVLTSPENAEALGEEILEWFNNGARELYDSEDRERGHVEVLNRRHVVERFPLMTLTIALVSTDRVPVTHLAELIDIAQELKAHGKGIPGSVLVGERRRRDDPPGEAGLNVA
ncbi:MAG TPA: response regulator [Candidatus Eisenbacteria bacterium]|nr:response regulator [Candidatus Eisenbacteria bacterium]